MKIFQKFLDFIDFFLTLIFSAAVVVYDVTSQDSFERAQRWISELRDQASKDIVIALAGNKVDLCQDTGNFEKF